MFPFQQVFEILSVSMNSTDILYSDHHFVAVNKAAGIPVGSEETGAETLLSMVRTWNSGRQVEGKKGYCSPIHFLDRPVSGVVLFGLSSKATSRLNELFRSKAISKTYLAVTSAVPMEPHGRLEHWLIKGEQQNVTKIGTSVDKGAKKSVLTYKVLDTILGKTLIEVRPETGRTHQIRVQLSSIGCPLFGDVKYGCKNPWNMRIALHAYLLEFKHPVGGQLMRIMAPLPDYWSDLIGSKHGY